MCCTTGGGRLTYCEVSVILQLRGITLTLMNVLYYRWGPSNLLWGICYTSVKGDNINFDECVVLQVGECVVLHECVYYRWGRLTYCEVSVILQLRGVTLTLMNGVVLQVGMNVLYYRSNLLWGICYTSVKGDNINFDECVVLQVGAV